MSSIPQVSEAMQQVLSERATALERSSGFVKRRSAHLRGAVFVQSLVFGFLANPQASYSQLRHVAASLGVPVSKQALEQRMGEGSVALLRAVLEEGVGQLMQSEAQVPALLARFSGIYLQDGTQISLPASLASQWPGNQTSPPFVRGSLRVQIRLEMARGQWRGLWLQAGREDEASGPAVQTPLPEGAIWVVDAGYRDLTTMRNLGVSGRFWLMPPVANLVIWDPRGVRCSLADLLSRTSTSVLDLEVQVGERERLPVRLLAVRGSSEQAERRRAGAQAEVSLPPKGVRRPNEGHRVPPTQTGKRDHHGDRQRKKRRTSQQRRALLEWTILMTNVPRSQLSVPEALVVYRCRWQMELLWKLGKEIVHVDTWRSGNPHRILTEILAKLLGLLVSHWVLLLECWDDPRHSTVKAHQVMQWMAPVLAMSLAGRGNLEQALASSAAAMRRGCRIDPRRKRPATYQFVSNPSLMSP